MHTLKTRPRSRAQLAYLAARDRYEEPARLGSLDARHKLRAVEESLLDWGRSQAYQLVLAGRRIEPELVAEMFDRWRKSFGHRDRLIELVLRLTV